MCGQSSSVTETSAAPAASARRTASSKASLASAKPSLWRPRAGPRSPASSAKPKRTACSTWRARSEYGRWPWGACSAAGVHDVVHVRVSQAGIRGIVFGGPGGEVLIGAETRRRLPLTAHQHEAVSTYCRQLAANPVQGLGEGRLGQHGDRIRNPAAGSPVHPPAACDGHSCASTFIALAYTLNSVWRNRTEFIRGREAIEEFSHAKMES